LVLPPRVKAIPNWRMIEMS